MLRTLIAVEKNATFSAAADEVFITHAAVSQQMRALETQLGVTLFNREKRTPELTLTGQAIVAKAKEVVAAYDDMVPSVTGMAGISGKVFLGAVPTTLIGLTPLMVILLKEKFAHLHVRIKPGLTHFLMTEIERGQLDVAIISKPPNLPHYFVAKPLVMEEMHLLAPMDTTETDATVLLRQNPFIRFNRQAVVGQLIESWLQKRIIKANEIMELENLEAISSMVAANLGVSIVPGNCVKSPNALPVKRLSLGKDAPKRELILIYRRDNPRTAVINALQTALEEAISIGSIDTYHGNRSTS